MTLKIIGRNIVSKNLNIRGCGKFSALKVSNISDHAKVIYAQDTYA